MVIALGEPPLRLLADVDDYLHLTGGEGT